MLVVAVPPPRTIKNTLGASVASVLRRRVRNSYTYWYVLYYY
eukprot:COSAG06_NODE_45810_length_352_cov_0.450593_1_plen_41_part_10